MLRNNCWHQDAEVLCKKGQQEACEKGLFIFNADNILMFLFYKTEPMFFHGLAY